MEPLAGRDRRHEGCLRGWKLPETIGIASETDLPRNFFEEDEVRAIFESLDLRARDSWTLFKLLDEEGNGDINLREFMEGCLRLRGPAKAWSSASHAQLSMTCAYTMTFYDIQIC